MFGGAMTWEKARVKLWALLVASLLISALFAIRVPFGDNPDETAHNDYIRLLIQERGFVRFIPHAQLPEGAPSRDEVHQPPLYYLLAAPVYAASGGKPTAVRMLAALFQLATIAVAFRACRDLFSERPEIAVGAAAFVAFLPVQAQLGGAINNDALTTLFCTAVFWRLGLLVTRGQDMRGAAILGALFGAGLLTKLTVFQLAPIILIAYLLAARARLLTTRQALLQCAAALGLALLIASPWLIRNTRLYGDPLAASIYTLTGPNYTPALIQSQFGLSAADYARSVGVRSFATFWYFLHPNLPIVPLARFVGSPGALVVVLVVSLGGLFGVYKAWANSSVEARRLQTTLLLGVVLLVPFFARFVFTVFQAQGRYFLPVLLPVALLTTLGWAALVGPGETASRRAFLGAMLAPLALLILLALQWLGGGFLGGAPAMR